MRQDVPLPQAYRLMNHGPTVLVSAAHGGFFLCGEQVQAHSTADKP